jgi:hypothetical protein
MNAFLAHIDIMPLIYGVVIFFGIYSMWWKLRRLKLFSFCIEVGIFILVFSLHGGTMTGGFSATVAALLAGIFMGRQATVRK